MQRVWNKVLTVMVIISTNINKNKQSPLILTELTEHKQTMIYHIVPNVILITIAGLPVLEFRFFFFFLFFSQLYPWFAILFVFVPDCHFDLEHVLTSVFYPWLTIPHSYATLIVDNITNNINMSHFSNINKTKLWNRLVSFFPGSLLA